LQGAFVSETPTMTLSACAAWVDSFNTEEGFDAEACLAEAVEMYQVQHSAERVQELDAASCSDQRVRRLQAWAAEASQARPTPAPGIVLVKGVGRVYEIPTGGTCRDILQRLADNHSVYGRLFDDREQELSEDDAVSCDTLKLCCLPLHLDWDKRDTTPYARAATSVNIGFSGALARCRGSGDVFSTYQEVVGFCRSPNITVTEECNALVYKRIVKLLVTWTLSATPDVSGLLQQLQGIGIVVPKKPGYGANAFRAERRSPCPWLSLDCTGLTSVTEVPPCWPKEGEPSRKLRLIPEEDMP